jgi:hypothetical protein
MSARRIAGGCTLILIAVASVPVYVLWCWGVFDPPDVSPIPFDPAAWQRADPIGKYRTVRSQMIGDLLQSRRLDGLSRAEVEALLGPPLANPASAGIDAYWHVVYMLGLERAGAWSLDDEFLVIRFDLNGRVTEYRTVVN